MPQLLWILNDPPYGTERSYNGLRHATVMAKEAECTVRIFLMADAVACARRGQQTANGYYNLERMLQVLVRQGAQCGACGTCMDARGLGEADVIAGVHRSTMAELSTWTLEADQVLVY